MRRVRETTRAKQDETPRTRIATALTALVVLAIAALGVASQADAARDPSASGFLAGAVKQAMQSSLGKQLPGLKITSVTCFVPTSSSAIEGKCTAKFTAAKLALKGVYRINGKLSNTSRTTVTVTSKACTDLRGRRASCTAGETSSGNGMISAALAETNLRANGISTQAKKLKVKSAVCNGIKSKKWQHAKFDDVYTQLKCSVKASDGGSYSVTFVMSGDGYGLTNVTRT